MAAAMCGDVIAAIVATWPRRCILRSSPSTDHPGVPEPSRSVPAVTEGALPQSRDRSLVGFGTAQPADVRAIRATRRSRELRALQRILSHHATKERR